VVVVVVISEDVSCLWSYKRNHLVGCELFHFNLEGRSFRIH